MSIERKDNNLSREDKIKSRMLHNKVMSFSEITEFRLGKHPDRFTIRPVSTQLHRRNNAVTMT